MPNSNFNLLPSPSDLPPEMNGWLVEMDIVRNSRVEELLRTGQGRPPTSSSPDTKRDSPDHKPRRAVMKVGEEGWYSQLMWPNARVPYAFHGFLSKCNTLSCSYMSKNCF